MMAAGRVKASVSGFVTVTAFGPSVCAGVVHMMVCGSTTVTPVAAAVPIVTAAPLEKSPPWIVTGQAPDAGLVAGTTDVMTGGGAVSVVTVPFPTWRRPRGYAGSRRTNEAQTFRPTRVGRSGQLSIAVARLFAPVNPRNPTNT